MIVTPLQSELCSQDRGAATWMEATAIAVQWRDFEVGYKLASVSATLLSFPKAQVKLKQTMIRDYCTGSLGLQPRLFAIF